MSSPVRGNALDFPQELIDEIISHNQDDIEFILTASLVFKAWRDTALRHLFLKVSFLSKADFIRWSAICASLPYVANYIQDINFHLAAK
ncbi:hypothetical protein BDZ89DRAFT_1143970 [Hymenopellis radicata]|nr:hypothetical protein BDZ89DRAFT_1143970 [Hymenopellis radicata]